MSARRTRTRNAAKARRTRVALPWLVACVYAQASAEPMRALIPPVSTGSAVAAAAPVPGSPPDRRVATRHRTGQRWRALTGEHGLPVGAIDARSMQLADGRQRRAQQHRGHGHAKPLTLAPHARSERTDEELTMHMHFTQIECHADARPGSTRTPDRCGPLAMPLTMKAPGRSSDPRWVAAS